MLGSTLIGEDTTHFTVWSPDADQIELLLLDADRVIPMEKDAHGYHNVQVEGVQAGDRYMYRLDGEKERPDPASHHQPEGVHGPSAVVDHAFEWTLFAPPTLRNTIFYEMHIGTFTEEGTFDAAIEHLPRLRDLGVTSIEVMPVAQFPGDRNWGYDGTYPYAVQHSYGGPEGFKRFVDAAHQEGLAVYLDVVYNHLGPEGNYLWDYGPYFTDRYKTVWGDALNYDGPHSDEVRRFFIENAVFWLDRYNLDGLRIDATHAIIDNSSVPFLQQLTERCHGWADLHNRRIHLIAENDRSDRRLIIPAEQEGVGCDALWLDDLHHVIHSTLTGEDKGYYADYANFELLPKILREGFAYTGQYAPARQRSHGSKSRDLPTDRFVVCTQNHDQVGNRLFGERLNQLIDSAGKRLAAGLVLLSPYVPLLFMGEEYAEKAPFQYFVSHGDEDLLAAVREGRKAEFESFEWSEEPPDPGAVETFERSTLNHDLRGKPGHKQMEAFYKALIAFRGAYPAITDPHREDMSVETDIARQTVAYNRGPLKMLFNCHPTDERSFTVMGHWRKVFDSCDERWGPGTNAPDEIAKQERVKLSRSGFVVYERVD